MTTLETLVSLLSEKEPFYLIFSKKRPFISKDTTYFTLPIILFSMDESNFIFNSEYTQLVDKFKDDQALSSELVDAFIEKLFVNEKHNIEIALKFRMDKFFV